ncbi:type 1 glutamine amidotransferase [Ruegeria sp. HKCCD6228]|uniref:type 1 glutamine amidotransferase n=1 Tax=unclassified Ruegeria TaxID=2625375 RepID=UPI00148889CC|nr:type 1 glutamine amidotransferase [Ruegeria sp. HKCCD6428]NOD98893.1 type 1 glutamine amidotransferase [Ruegeria sp. HKCCD6228]
MRIALLELTLHPLPLLEGLPRTAQQIRAWLEPHLPEARFSTVDVVDGEALPQLGDFDGVVVGGSEFGVYDDTEWMRPLRDFLELCRDHAKPVFGICFGHQIMADVYGGKAEKAEIGNVVGARGFDYGGSSVDAFVWHQDQVTHVPPSARVTGSADHCPVGALDYNFPARSVQFHPEYRASHLRELFVRGRDVFLAPQEADEGLASIKAAHVSKDLAAAQAVDLFRKACGRP